MAAELSTPVPARVMAPHFRRGRTKQLMHAPHTPGRSHRGANDPDHSASFLVAGMIRLHLLARQCSHMSMIAPMSIPPLPLATGTSGPSTRSTRRGALCGSRSRGERAIDWRDDAQADPLWHLVIFAQRISRTKRELVSSAACWVSPRPTLTKRHALASICK
jgi:hypothetical protein